MTNKKKLWIIAAAVLVFAALATGAILLQNALLSGGGEGTSLTPAGLSLTSSSSLSSSSDDALDDSGADSSASSSVDQSSASSSQGSISQSGSASSQQQSVSSSASSAVSKPEPQGTVNFTFRDTVSGKTVFSGAVACPMDGATAGNLTREILDRNTVGGKTGNYSITGAGPTIYFEMIAGLRQFGAGPSSGWIFGIKKAGESSYTRSNVGAGSVTLYPGDSIEWRYMANGL